MRVSLLPFLPVPLLVVGFLSCTKTPELPRSPDGKPLVSRQADPERVVFESLLEMPKEYQGKLGKTDLMIWDLKNAEGEVVAAQITPIPKFPATLTVTARQLFTPVPEGASLTFGARIVKFGDEGKPPAKGQLQVLVGLNPPEGELVENKAVNQKQLDKFLKKQKMSPAQELSIGTRIRAEFAPATM